MKIAREKLISDYEVLSHVFMESLVGNSKNAEEIIESWRDENQELPDEYEVQFIVNGMELNVERFFNLLWDQYSTAVENHATEIVKQQSSHKFLEFQEKLYQMEQIINDWSNEISWNVENPFKNKA